MKERDRKFHTSISFLVTEDMFDVLITFAKKRKLSLSKVARDIMIEGMKGMSKEIGSMIDGK